MDVCMYVHVSACVHVRVCMHVRVRVHVRMYVCACTCTCECVCACALCFLIRHRFSTGFEATEPGFECWLWHWPALACSFRAEPRSPCLQSGNDNPPSAENGVESVRHYVKTAKAGSKVTVTVVAAVTRSLTATGGSHWSLLTHGPPVERAHEGEDAVLGAAGGLGPRNSGGQSQL